MIAPLAMRPFAPSQRNALSLNTGRARPPLGLLAGILRADGVSWRERITTIRWFARQRRGGFRCSELMSVTQLIEGLSSTIREGLLVPLCIAALNTPPGRASAQVFLNVLREAFDDAPDGSAVVLPRHDLGHVIPERCAAWLVANGHNVRRSTRVKLMNDARGIRVLDGEGEMLADAAVVAVGPHQLRATFDTRLAESEASIGFALETVERFEWEAITTVYLAYAQAVSVPSGLVRLDDAPGQWVFDRADILARASENSHAREIRSLLAVVLSAHRAGRDAPAGSLSHAVDAQLRRLDPSLPPLAWSKVIAEKRATYACVPGLARPPNGRLARGIYLAGDYTYERFPATLEAAVRSGIAAAQAVTGDFRDRACATGVAARDSTPAP
ncbi:MAG TPA: FAD-dependent oxidoreductase [Rhodanobacteraceae bacterium]